MCSTLKVQCINLVDGDNVLALPASIKWNRCYLENTNLASTFDEDAYACEIIIPQATQEYWQLNANSGTEPEVKHNTFVITKDDFNPLEKQYVVNENPDYRIQSAIKITITGLGGSVCDTEPGFMLLRFETD